MDLVGWIGLHIVLGGAFVAFGASTLAGESFVPGMDSLGLSDAARVGIGIVALAGGAGMIVGIGVPKAAVAGALLIVLSLGAYIVAATLRVTELEGSFSRCRSLLLHAW